MRDVLYSLRQFAKSPGFTFLTVLCLGLGIGVNASIFSVLNSLFLRPLPVSAPDRVVALSRSSGPLLSYPDFLNFRDRTTTMEGMAASNPTESSLDFDGVAHNAGAEAVSIDYPQVIGVRPLLGRWFQTEDEDACVISYRAWQRFFAADPNVIGKRVRSETQWYTIVGVAPKEFQGIYLPLSMDLWVPLRHWMKQHPGIEDRMNDRGQPSVFIFGRLKPGRAPRQASVELNSIALQFPRTEAKVLPIVAEQVRGIPSATSRHNAAPIAGVLMAVVAVILMIACVNVGNLLLARGAARHREISVRVALGARRARLLRQFLTESLLLAIAGGFAGLIFGYWTNRALELLLSAGPFDSVSLDLAADTRVLLFVTLLSLATTLFFGLAPAWRASQVDVLTGLKGDAPAQSRFGLRRVSLIAQVSLSLILLLTAGLFLRVLGEFRTADPGFAVANRMYAWTYVSAPEFTPESARAFYSQVTDRLRSLPGVKSVALTNYLPLTPIAPGCASLVDLESIPATTSIIGPGFLETMQAPIVAGRDFRDAEPHPVVIVNQAMAKRLWPNESALGKQVRIGCRNPSAAEVIGVARDLRFVSVGEPAKPHAYRPFSNYQGLQTLVLETVGQVPDLPKLITAVNPSARVYAVKPLSAWVDQSFWQIRWEVSVLGAFAVLALVLSAVGLYGMIAYHVSLRRREIGVRMAIGAQNTDIFKLILRQGLTSTLIGIAVGLTVSALITRALPKFLYGVSPTDPATYAGASLLWLLVAAAACYLPARRASQVDPMEVLRNE
ncbi:MAG TPA: ABC transporter permease [Bryobacteraceae bacterium]|jgi:macrolide transport system ATP-binding/permease protein|nr:ABC transporter permease [Bryobacteraceae bacterium]